MVLNQWQERIAETLFKNASSLKYGSTEVTLKIHDGRIAGIIYTVSENIRYKDKEIVNETSS